MNKLQPRHAVRRPRVQLPSWPLARGLSLVEMLVSLTIGLFLIAGAMAVFMAATTTGARKDELDKAVEAFRFGSFSLSRAARQAIRVCPTSTPGSDLTSPPTPGRLSLKIPANVESCDGVPYPTDRVNVYTVSGGGLRCTVSIVGAAEPACPGLLCQSLVDGVYNVTFLYGSDATTTGANRRVAGDEFTTAPTDWSLVSSVRVFMTLDRAGNTGIRESFVITLRMKTLELTQTSSPPSSPC